MDEITVNDLRASWKRSLTANNKSKGTIRVYLAALDHFVAIKGDLPIAGIQRSDVEDFIADRLEVWKATTVSVDYRALQQFFRWAQDEGEIENHPMLRMKPPKLVTGHRPVIEENTWERLLATCRGHGFYDRRDRAMLWVFKTSGIRLNELTGMTVLETDVNRRRALVHGKGRKDRIVPFDLQAANAIESYLRVRKKHPQSFAPELWLGHQGALTPNGLYQAIRRRAKDAGVPVHPHLFRHTFAHEFLSRGGREGDLMTLAGWEGPAMIRVYARNTATDRALASYDERMLHTSKPRD